MKTNYWLSWYHPTDLHFSLSAPHWTTGYTPDNQATVCSAVQALSPYQAKEIIANAYQPFRSAQAIIWRFCESKPDGWQPFNDRFPKGDFVWEPLNA